MIGFLKVSVALLSCIALSGCVADGIGSSANELTLQAAQTDALTTDEAAQYERLQALIGERHERRAAVLGVTALAVAFASGSLRNSAAILNTNRELFAGYGLIARRFEQLDETKSGTPISEQRMIRHAIREHRAVANTFQQISAPLVASLANIPAPSPQAPRLAEKHDVLLRRADLVRRMLRVNLDLLTADDARLDLWISDDKDTRGHWKKGLMRQLTDARSSLERDVESFDQTLSRFEEILTAKVDGQENEN